ncbi:hypothetical protein ABEB36_005724 [Hypothenemus hampei]|uniref:peptidylprolyl isomerase n=1 Tax=Hypothenemus hampei TaxID=57062 RepID=A0ABD1EZ79_HYPHA
MSEVDISPDKDKGVLKQIIVEGSENSYPPSGSKVKVHYTGTLEDGTQFDSSRDRGEPFQFDLGKGKVIKAWEIGIATMKKGERAILTCKPEYAYGFNGSPPTIPSNATLKFDVELLDWMGEYLNEDKGIERVETLTRGVGFLTPNDGARVEIHLTGIYNGNTFEDRDVAFNIGEGSESNVVPGVEIALEKFKNHESSRLIIKGKYAFGSTGSPEFNIPPDATVEYVVTLNKFEKTKASWAMDRAEKIEQSEIFKEQGTKYFQSGKYDLALKKYKKIQTFLENETDTDDAVIKQRKALLLASYCNSALCYLKLKDYSEAKNAATKALELDEKNEKALYRRGQAYIGLQEPALASADFNKCLEVNPNNSAARSQLALTVKLKRQQLEAEKKKYGNMFEVFARRDTQVNGN